jgi:hypothetical protein
MKRYVLPDGRPARAATTLWWMLGFAWRSLELANESRADQREDRAKRSHTTKWSPSVQDALTL